MRDVLRRYPAARWYQYEPAGGNSSTLGARLAFGDFATPVYNFAAADRVLSLDSNFLECGPASLRYARDFASRRRVRDGQTQEICRLYAVESTPTNTGTFADHRLSLRPTSWRGWRGPSPSASGSETSRGASAWDFRRHS